jgi:beta-glucosidase
LGEHTDSAVDYSEGAIVGYPWYAAKQLHPLFPFGFGLSYTSFSVDDLTIQVHEPLTVRFSVRNTGERAGTAVPQVYLVDGGSRPTLRLVAFERVTLDAGEQRSIQAVVDPRLLAQWQTRSQHWLIKPGRYSFAAGTSSEALGPATSVELSRRQLRP